MRLSAESFLVTTETTLFRNHCLKSLSFLLSAHCIRSLRRSAVLSALEHYDVHEVKNKEVLLCRKP